MKNYQLSEIKISPDRMRRDLSEEFILELAESIAVQGLFHAIVVRDTDAGPQLVAGERRLRAVAHLHSMGIPFHFNNEKAPLDHVPTITLGELSELDSLEAEYSENAVRRDLSWQERATAIAKLHILRSQQAHAAGTVQTFTATASEILGKPAEGSQITEVAQAIQVAKHLGDKEVARAESPRAAMKIVERKARQIKHVELAAAIGTVAIADRHKLINGDALTTLLTLPDQLCSVLLTDPPYGINAQDFGGQAGEKHAYEDSYEQWQDLMVVLAQQFTRIARVEAHAYVFCDPRRWLELSNFFSEEGWDVWPAPLIWSKATGMLPRPTHGPRRTYEAILYAIRGNKEVLKVATDVLSGAPDRGTGHAAQKPVSLFAELLSRSARPGDTVIDPFCGSGTIFPAANRLNLRAIGIELNPIYYAIASTRLNSKDE